MNYNKNSHITPGEGHLSQSDCEQTDLSQTPAHSHGGSAYDRITQRIIDLLGAGTIPWRKPWNVALAFPRNLITRPPSSPLG